MARTTNPKQRLSPFAPKLVQPNAPATTSAFGGLAAGVQSLWYQCLGSKHSYGAILPSLAPTATVTAANTATDFIITDGTENPDWEFPWWMQEQFDVVRAQFLIAHQGQVGDVALQLESKTLVTSVTSAYSEYVDIGPGVLVPPGPWRAESTGIWSYSVVGLQVAPSLPADRTVALKPHIKWAPLNTDANALSLNRVFKIFGVRFEDDIAQLSQGL